jgi:hypothetical protein
VTFEMEFSEGTESPLCVCVLFSTCLGLFFDPGGPCKFTIWGRMTEMLVVVVLIDFVLKPLLGH